jgi:oxygen-independent coproporphyrinogen-3 oxidase
LPEYHESVAAGRLPVVRGYALDRDDELRRDVIMALMCQGRARLRCDRAGARHRDGAYFARELRRCRASPMRASSSSSERAVQVTTAGWFLIRAVAMVFDKHLQAARDRGRFSKVV